MNILSPHEAVPDDGYYNLSASGTVKVILFIVYQPDQSDCTPEQQLKNLEAVGKGMALAKTRGFNESERLANQLARASAANGPLIATLLDRLLSFVTPQEFLKAAGFDEFSSDYGAPRRLQ